MNYLLIFAVAAVVTALITPTIRYFGLKFSIIDHRSKRKLHNRVVTRFGGLAIYFGFIFAMAIAFIFGSQFGQKDFANYLMVIIASTLVLILGIFDDSRGANALIKFSVQILAALVLIQSGFVVRIISNPFGNPINLGIFAIPITVLWLVGITNAINLIDGIDGLAVGIMFIVCVSLFCMFLITGDIMPAFFAMALAGACFGFLRYNYPPAKIFMGDTGSLFLGFSVAALVILTNHKEQEVTSSLLIPAIIGLAIPICDTSMAFFRRLVIKKGNPFHADTGHVHHLLLRLELKHKEVAIILWILTAIFNVAAVALYYYLYKC